MSYDNRELLSIKEASARFGVTEYFLRNGLKAGNIPYVRNGKKYYICATALSNILRYGQNASNN